MASWVASSPVPPTRDLHFRQSLYQSRCCKLRERRVSQDQDGRRNILLLWDLVNSRQFGLLGLHCRHRPLSNFDSPTSISFSSSAFLNSVTVDILSKMRKRLDKGGAESPAGLCRSSLLNKEDELVENVSTEEDIRQDDGGGSGDNNSGGGGGGGWGGGGGDAVGWISSALMFTLWAGFILYAATVAPNQTQYRDIYFIEKLVGLRADDGFSMNKVLVAEFYLMGLFPVIYTSLLIPTGRSRNLEGIKVWPFAVASFFVGAFALLPYFGLWRPPPPAVSTSDLSRYPLNVLESKIIAVGVIIGGLVLAWYACFAGGDQWAEFVQYLEESRFINIMTTDFLTLSALAPFWVYNDFSIRQRSNSLSWLPSIALVPFFGPALYLFLRPPLASSNISDGSEEISDGTGSS